MNQKTKNVGLLAIFSLALGTSPGMFSDAAANVGSQDVIGRPGYDPGKVCGDRLCHGDDGPNVGSQDVIGRPGYDPGKVCGDRLCSESPKGN